MAARQRLDTLLTDRGLFPSRSRAAASVMAGEVRLGPDRRRAEKPGEMVAQDTEVAVAAGSAFVSRGGIKLANALAAAALPVAGRRALDVGASTGGFTDCLLQHGAAAVVALDVGYGDLDWGLRNDPRVTVMERTNARHLTAGELPYEPDLATVDASFISLRKVLPAILAVMTPRFDVLALVKPQFEVGRSGIGKGGVVRDAGLRRGALEAVAESAVGLGAAVLAFHSSGLPGPKGNLETFIHLAEGDRPQAVRDGAAIAALARRAEP